MNKDVGLRVRIDRSLRERFLNVCRAQDKPAAQVLREFMRQYVETHAAANDQARASRPRKGGARYGNQKI